MVIVTFNSPCPSPLMLAFHHFCSNKQVLEGGEMESGSFLKSIRDRRARAGGINVRSECLPFSASGNYFNTISEYKN
jgi:hypothetical protein